MKQQILKALANPSRIFYVPYSLAVINFTLQFLIFIAIFVASLIVSDGAASADPLIFLVSVITVHSILGFFSKQEPQLGQIISSKIQIYKQHIPERLKA